MSQLQLGPDEEGKYSIEELQDIIANCTQSDHKGYTYVLIPPHVFDKIETSSELSFLFGLSIKNYMVIEDGKMIHFLNRTLKVFTFNPQVDENSDGYISSVSAEGLGFSEIFTKCILMEQFQPGVPIQEFWDEHILRKKRRARIVTSEINKNKTKEIK